jgi:hypothetical protein
MPRAKANVRAVYEAHAQPGERPRTRAAHDRTDIGGCATSNGENLGHRGSHVFSMAPRVQRAGLREHALTVVQGDGDR